MKKANMAFLSLFVFLTNQQTQAIDFTAGIKSAMIAYFVKSSSKNTDDLPVFVAQQSELRGWNTEKSLGNFNTINGKLLHNTNDDSLKHSQVFYRTDDYRTKNITLIPSLMPTSRPEKKEVPIDNRNLDDNYPMDAEGNRSDD